MEKRFMRSFCSFLLAVLMLFVSIVPSFASSAGNSGSITGLWDSYLYAWVQNTSGTPFGSAVQTVAGLLCADVCGSSSDGVHHASSVTSEFSKDAYGNFALATCDYCHERFKVYGSDLQSAYDDYVGELPGSVYDSDGGFLWQSTFSDFSSGYVEVRMVAHSYGSTLGIGLNNLTYPYTFDVTYDIVNDHTLVTYPLSNSSRGSDSRFYFGSSYGSSISVVVPVSGFYTPVSSVSVHYTMLTSDSSDRLEDISYYTAQSGETVVSGQTIKVYPGGFSNMGSWVDFRCYYYLPIFRVIPVDDLSQTVYSLDSRPTSITGNYGIIGSDGTINNVSSNTIVNETNNTVYNPVTDTTTPITSWSYDYSDRSYNVVTESGDTITITYGDENITINEGDTIYNVYYVVDDPGSGDGEDGCSHDWVQTSTTEPSCTASGKTVYTCSLCGETKKETVKALGHEWLAKKTVTTQYDDDGNLIQEGYTLYECERCGEQYKDASGNGPPSLGTGGNGGGSGSGTDSDGLFSGIFGIVWDFFTFFFDFFSDFVVGGIKGFVSGLLDAGSDFFAILNPFDWGY